jgi:CyaY protein
MTESEFNELADGIFTRIEDAIDAHSADIDYTRKDSVLELDMDDGSPVIVSRHGANQEIWIAAKAGGFHYAFHDGKWLSRRDGSELFAKLEELLTRGAGKPVLF